MFDLILHAQTMGPCQPGLARPQDTDRITASNMEGSCEYIE
jgi:hypothetical protein